MKHSVSSSVCDDSGVAALFPVCWGFGDCTSPFCASVSFSDNHHLVDFIWYWAHLENYNLLAESTNPIYYSFFPSSSKYPTANYKAKSDVFTAVKAAISQLLSERRWNHTQATHRREPTRRIGGKTVAPFPSPRPPQGIGSPTCPHSTADPTIFRGLGGVATQLLLHEPPFS